MKTSLDHLSAGKREELARIVEILREVGPVEMVVLFGSHARGDWVDDRMTGYKSDYDLLVVTRSREVAEDGALWGTATQRIAKMDLPSVDLIVHDFKFVNEQLAHGQYFFKDIATEGVLLYTSGAFTFPAKRAPTPAQRQEQAEGDFERFFTSAHEFYDTYGDDLAKGRHNKSAFELHQATERFFAAFLLTFTGYMPKLHDIEKLADIAAGLHPDMRPLLPRVEPEDKRLFDLLKKAYVDARYSPKYSITADELRALGPQVEELGRVIERVCREKIATLDRAAGA
jgi:predicted nucleotidyltransferase/HEPN domain-containing protein